MRKDALTDRLPTARQLSGDALAAALRDSRARTLAFTFDLSDAQWRMPLQAGVNPVAWELAHLAWFAEFWILRGPHMVDARGRVGAARPARIAGPDALFDSSLLAHERRWEIELPSRAELLERLQVLLDACIAALPDDAASSDDALYFHRLALFHEDMHGEAFAWMRSALGWPAPDGLAPPAPMPPERDALGLPAATHRIGWPDHQPGFAFDNERDAHSVALDAFEIDATPVSTAAFLAFFQAGGYDDAALWPGASGTWRAAQTVAHPARWRRQGGRWQTRWFDQWLPLETPETLAAPMLHVNAFEAEAFARQAGRRLPSGAEWESAAQRHGSAFHWGHGVWEWTASAFAPYPGFAPGPYRDYSAPWFGDHREVRGGAFATHPRMHNAAYRNFFQPHRTDVFTGFRTAATRFAGSP